MRDTVDQAWLNRRKALCAAIRLKYSIMADNEINKKLDVERKRFDKQVLQGMLPGEVNAVAALNAGYQPASEDEAAEDA